MFSDFEAIKLGEARSITRTVTEADVRRFVEMTGDDNPLHVDRAYAETTPFKDIVVHGMLGASFLSTVIGTRLPGPGALWVSQSLEFLAPVRLGDVLTVTCTITAKHPRDRLLELDARITNASGQAVLTGHGVVKVLATRERPPEAPAAARRVALVTGAAGGIGRAICRRLAEAGVEVVAAHRSRPERLQAVSDALAGRDGAGRIAPVQADLSTEAGARALATAAERAFGPVDILVNAASPAIGARPFAELGWSEMQEHLDVQVRAAFHLSQACVASMRERRFGRIVNITSQVVDGPPTPTWTAYAVAKAALAALSRQLAAELGPSGVTVNCVAPGMTETPLIGDIPEKAQLMAARATPLRRLALPEDVADAVAYLASDGAGFVTGHTLAVNGGALMR